MKKSIFLLLSFVCAAAALAGCSVLAGEKIEGGGDENTLKIRLGSQARYIEAYSFSLSSFTEWTLTLTDESDAAAGKIVLSTGLSADGAASLSYADEVLTAKNISPGTYTAEISGSCTDSAAGTTCSIAGRKSGVEIKQGKTASAEIHVGLAKTSGGKGSLSLTLTDETGELTQANTQNLVVSLLDLASGSEKYSTESTENPLDVSYTDGGSDQNSALVIKGSGIASGWYKIAFYLDNSFRIYVPSEYQIIEIADGITTTKSGIALYGADKKAYYAANSVAEEGNGLASVSRISLSALLSNLAAALPDEGELDIYMDGAPEIDLDKLAELKAKIAEKEKLIYVYNTSESTETAAVSIETTSSTGSDSAKTYTTATNITGALTLTAGTEKTLDVSTITVADGSAYTITLKNGAALNVTTASISGTLGICAVVSTTSTSSGQASSTTTENFSAYTSAETPFITAKSSISDKIALYEYGNDNLSKCYAVAYDTESSSGIWTYNYKIKPVVGSIILANGKLVAPSSYTEIDESNPPIAIAVGLNSNDKIIGIGLHTSTTNFYWATVNTTGSTMNFADIVSTATESQVTSALTYSFTGDTDGSDNWDVISSVDENAETTAETNYPAFYWANNYASTYNSCLGGVTDGWYMPSIAELYIVFKNNLDTLNSVLASINALKSEYSDSSLGDSRTYWSSSQTPSTDYGTYLMSFASGSITAGSRYNKGYVLVVRAFN